MKYTNEDIRKHDPCYDPIKHIKEDQEFTLLELLDRENIPPEDRIWVFSRLATEKQCRLFACYYMESFQTDIQEIKDFQTLVLFMNESVNHSRNVEHLKDEDCWSAYSAACWAAYSAADSAACKVADREIRIEIARYVLEGE